MKEYLGRIERDLKPLLDELPTDARIGVGMSGGVDSSVTAWALQSLGVATFGVFMRNWHETDEYGRCSAEQDFQDVQLVSEQLQLPYYSIDLSSEYQQQVFAHFVSDIKSGLTPNPDVLCNREIKFAAFWQNLKKMGAHHMATGHYAKIHKSSAPDQLNSYLLKKATDTTKDQSYFLAQVPYEMLSRSLFPLGSLLKHEVRAMAQKLQLATSTKKDSTGICFIGERDFKEFLFQYIQQQKGIFCDLAGNYLGHHEGACFYTIGQRKGLNIGGPEGPWFVAQKDTRTNKVYLTNEIDHAALHAEGMTVTHMNWLVPESEAQKIRAGEKKVSVKIRYRQKDLDCSILQDHRDLTSLTSFVVQFQQPQRAVTAGQFAVFYLNDGTCVGGGVIQSVSSKYWAKNSLL